MAQAKKKKKFFEVEIPTIKKETQLFAFEIEDLNGRYIKYDLTRFLRGKNMILTSKVEVKNGKAAAISKEIQLLPYFLSKMVRKGTNYVEDSFTVECRDAIVRIKPFLITRRKVARAVRKALREKAREELTEYAKGKTSEALFNDIIQGRIQKPLSLKLKKIYPLSLCEIRILKVEKELEKKPGKEPEEETEKQIEISEE
ncbi:MAG: hypothetical protein AABW50_01780 [Nanoarchaeota archaeon]